MPDFFKVGLDHYIGEDAGEIKLDGEKLPGLLQRMTIRGGLKTESAETLGGGASSQPLGFKAAVIYIELRLFSNSGGEWIGGESTCYDKLEELNVIFTAVTDDINAKVHKISNSQADARGIKWVWFSELESSEGHNDVITARLTLTQKEPPDFKKYYTAQPPKTEATGGTMELKDEGQ